MSRTLSAYELSEAIPALVVIARVYSMLNWGAVGSDGHDVLAGWSEERLATCTGDLDELCRQYRAMPLEGADADTRNWVLAGAFMHTTPKAGFVATIVPAGHK